MLRYFSVVIVLLFPLSAFAVRTAVTVQDVGRYAGSAVATQAAPDQANGNSVINDGKTFLIVRATGTITLTVAGATTPNRAYGSTITKTYAFTNGQIRFIGPFAPEVFNQSDGTMNLDWDATTGTISAITYTPTPQ